MNLNLTEDFLSKKLSDLTVGEALSLLDQLSKYAHIPVSESDEALVEEMNKTQLSDGLHVVIPFRSFIMDTDKDYLAHITTDTPEHLYSRLLTIVARATGYGFDGLHYRHDFRDDDMTIDLNIFAEFYHNQVKKGPRRKLQGCGKICDDILEHMLEKRGFKV